MNGDRYEIAAPRAMGLWYVFEVLESGYARQVSGAMCYERAVRYCDNLNFHDKKNNSFLIDPKGNGEI